MAEEWFAEGVQICEDGTDEFFAEGVQWNEDSGVTELSAEITQTLPQWSA
jgi:hypothetical protein